VLIFSANSPSIYEKGFMAICASFLKIKVIIAPRGGPLNMEIEQSKFLKKFVTYAFSRSTYIVCQGRYWKDFFSALLPQDQSSKFVIIPNWIDIDHYDYSNIQKYILQQPADPNQSKALKRIVTNYYAENNGQKPSIEYIKAEGRRMIEKGQLEREELDKFINSTFYKLELI
jgi:hypothetical protein